jgi:hypothetical protein
VKPFLPNWGGDVVFLTQLYWPSVHPALQERRKRDLTSKQLAILNSLVTYAAEHIPGGLSEDEREVAQIVGGWTLNGNTAIVEKTYRPVFVGKTEKDEKIVLYSYVGSINDVHICVDDGELRAINLGAEIHWWSDSLTGTMHIQIVSAVWTGSASGTRYDLIAEEAR